MGNRSEGEKVLYEFRKPPCRKITLQKKEIFQCSGRNIEIRLTKTNCSANKSDDYFFEIPSGNNQG